MRAEKPGGTTGEQDRLQPRVPAWGNKTSKPLAVKSVGVAVVRETSSLLEHTQTHPPKIWHQKGPICLWVSGEVTESWWRDEQAALFSLRPLPHIQHHNPVNPGLHPPPPPSEYIRLRHLLCNRLAETKYMAQMKEQITAPKTELSDEERTNISDEEFKTLVIRMLTEMAEYGRKMEE